MRATTVGVLAGAAVLATLAAQTDENDRLRSIGQGRAIYLANCASCHGADLKGGAADLGSRSKGEVAIPDLATIEARDGRFDARHIARHIGGEDRGRWDPCTTGMACWEHVFSEQRGAAVARLQLFNLVNYLRSVQQTPVH